MSQFREVAPVNQSLYPTFDSTRDALQHARELLPDVPQNTFMKAFMSYHNTLLKTLENRA